MKAFSRENLSASSNKYLNISIAAVVGLGIFFRIFHFLHNRSFWLDEMYLSSSLIKMNFIELATAPLDYQQKAPIGYLWLVKLSVILFGNGDMALRLVPFLGGIFSLLFFIPVAKYFLKHIGIVIAIGILALSPHIIYHSVEAKQYSTEVLSSILVLFLFIKYHTEIDYRSLLMWGFWGALIIWFSFSSIFILAGMAGGISLFYLIKKDWRNFFLYLIPFMLWMISFAVNYVFFTSRFSDSGWLVQWFLNREGFIPSGLGEGFSWLVKKVFSFFDFPLGLSWFSPPSGWYGNSLVLALVRMVIIPLALLIAGLWYLYKKNLQALLILIFPLLLHLFATLLLIYPFYERLTVYLAPLMILPIAIGAEALPMIIRRLRFSDKEASSERIDKAILAQQISDSKKKSYKGKLSLPLASVILAALVLFGPLMHSLIILNDTEKFGYDKNWRQREVYNYINQNFQKGDAVYVYWNSLVPYHYYKQVRDFKFNAIEGKDYRFFANNMDDYLKKIGSDLKELKSYKRVWVVLGDNFVLNIGDFDNKPSWYYGSKDYVSKKHALFNSLGSRTYEFKTQENINLILFEKD